MPLDEARVLNPTSRLMLVCLGGSQLSEAVFRMAVAWWLLGATGSAALFGSVIAVSNLAMTFTHATLGWMGDRYPRRLVIASAYAIDMAACGALCALAFADAASPAAVATLLVLGTVGNTLAGPLHSTIALQSVPQAEAQEFIRARTSLTSLVMVGGPVIAGVLLSLFEATTLMVLHAVALVTICAALWANAARNSSLAVAPASDISMRGRLQLIFSGLAMLWKIAPERSLCLHSMLGNFVVYPLFAVVLPVLVKDQLEMPPWALGAAGACFGVGALASSQWLAKPAVLRLGRFRAVLVARFVTMGGLAFATVFYVLATGSGLAVWLFGSLLGLAAAGVGFSVLNVAVSQARALATPDALRNRLLTAAAAIVTLAVPLGSAGAGWLLAHVAPAGVLAAVVLVLAVATALLCVDASARSLLQTPDAQLPEAYTSYLRGVEGAVARPIAS